MKFLYYISKFIDERSILGEKLMHSVCFFWHECGMLFCFGVTVVAMSILHPELLTLFTYRTRLGGRGIYRSTRPHLL